jgi:ABC-2 type transport system ATP-binding protein
VLLSSHILAQVEKLCDRVSIIRAGRIVESGSLDDLRHLTRTTVVARTDAPATELGRLDGVHHLELDGATVRLDVDGEALGQVIAHLSGLGVRSLVSHPPTLEQLFLRHYGEELAPARSTT